MNTLDPTFDPGPSREALALYRCIHRYGGSMRMRTLLRQTNSAEDNPALWSIIGELTERYWITLAWRKNAPDRPPDAPCPLGDVDRLCATRFGKRKAPQRLWGMRRNLGPRR